MQPVLRKAGVSMKGGVVDRKPLCTGRLWFTVEQKEGLCCKRLAREFMWI
jgi:hypothetical protein